MTRFPFPGKHYQYNLQTKHSLFTLLAGGHIQTSPSFHCSPEFSSSYLILYTLSGHGRIVSPLGAAQLEANSLLFTPCNQDCLIQKLTDDWDFYLFFIDAAHFYSLPFTLPANQHFLHIFQTEPKEILHILERLNTGNTSEELLNKLHDHELLTSLFCSIASICPTLYADAQKPPTYLLKMKEILDTQYDQPHSLEEFEILFSISRFRLCREFSNTFGRSPLQYLNHLRIQKSLLLIRDTDHTIREIGSAVGIDNTNHFIHLFKRQIGVTPLIYRQQFLSLASGPV